MRYLMMLLIGCFLIGCTKTITVNPNIETTTKLESKIPLLIGLHIPDDIKSYSVLEKKSLYEYNYHMGEAVAAMIQKSIGEAFLLYELLEMYPLPEMIRERKYDLVAVAELKEGDIDYNAGREMGTGTGTYNYPESSYVDVAVSLTFYDSTMKLVTVVQGRGVSGALGDSSAEENGQNAIRKMGDDLIWQISHSQEIQKKVKRLSP